jgi:hypothetical protein
MTKPQYEVHHNNACYTSDDDELRATVDMPVPSEDPASASSEGKNHEDENYHLHVDKKLKAGSSIGAGPSQVKRVKKEKHLLHSWMTILILRTPS